VKWFRRKRIVERPTKLINYPSGLAVDTEQGVWYIKNNTKYKLFSNRVVRSWCFDVIAYGSEKALVDFKNGGFLGFRDGSLLQNISDGKIYLVSDSKRRHIKTPDAFSFYGLDESKIIKVSEREINLHDQGASIE
jgi:hypothetical protein